MNAAVVTIRGDACRRRKNRSEDAKTIQLRRLLTNSEAAAFEDENATALALSWAMKRQLPCSNLRLIAGTLDEETDFKVRLAEVDLAKAELAAFGAKIERARLLHGDDAARAMRPENDDLFARYRQATVDMATTPVFTRLHLDWKKRAIGRIWLNAEGAWYDQLRAAVAEDEARVAKPKTGKAV